MAEIEHQNGVTNPVESVELDNDSIEQSGDAGNAPAKVGDTAQGKKVLGMLYHRKYSVMLYCGHTGKRATIF